MFLPNEPIRPFTLELGGAIPYECLSFTCSHCRVRLTLGITTEMIYGKHGSHLENVTLEIKIVATGEILEVQPVSRSLC